ncbi:energy-coupling factor transporter transmembrane protein EcfT [Neobacillus sp. MM2021_6]|uniref:energy-coupling factor transporter transmembrane component T family protein n=1 Tax=Bacillaceae TaxID=186817 RepID=UPI00140BA374|nr:MULTISPECIES: energy-coupling factor transporter transmembrane component T [Bacillaceae]MBO0959719.1 energy-coupling factor transporter transmembrane protein EcfT [Neobacillus sp. MM2021_6]NHC19201.1 energy-coupling factor transporter transmembrane protein EcfT [Bacillus sp. MM2020_4]
MKSISLFVDRKSFIHEVDPITKLIYILFALFIPIILPSFTISFVCLGFSLLLLIAAKVIRKTVPVFGFVFFVLITVVIIQGLFKPENETVLFQIGQVAMYKEGLLYALTITLRVTNIVSSFMILVLTTKPSDLVETLVRKGMSPRIGYVIVSVFQIIPEMMSSMETIMDAQRARGMETEGSLLVRIKAFVPLLGPVILGALINTKERAMALEVRGFNSRAPKTYLMEEKTYAYSGIVRLVMLLLVVGAIAWRIFA